jgi:large subunit ribosomal protein L25
MDRITLDATPRTVVGKKVRFLRRTGITPVNVFGHNVSSLALEVKEAALERALARAGTNALISLRVAGSTEPRPVLIRGHQRRATSGKLLHVDLYQVSMTETITTDVPLVLVGTAPALSLSGVLLKNLDAVEIECLPADLVSSIEVDMSGLAEIGQAVLVSDLKVSSAIKILTNPETLVVKIMAPEEEKVEEAAPAAEVAPVAEGEAAPAESEAPASEKSS